MNQKISPATLDPYRLPRHVVPIRYDLRLEPDLTVARFAGQETVTLTVLQPTSDIVLNAIDLDITSAQIEGESSPPQQATIMLDEALQRCHLTFGERISAGEWKLTILFTGTLNDKLRGFYRSTYKGEDGVTHSLAATQFEATAERSPAGMNRTSRPSLPQHWSSIQRSPQCQTAQSQPKRMRLERRSCASPIRSRCPPTWLPSS